MFGDIFTDFFSLLAPKPVNVPEPSGKYIEARNEVGEVIILDMQNVYLSQPSPVHVNTTRYDKERKTPNPPLEM
jgi:type II secretory pathway component PulC